MQFKINSKFKPAGDQPKAINELISGISRYQKDQVLLGVTGSGKTFTMANVIAKSKKPAIIMAHNKTLAAQLYEEMKEFFPNNAVEYFVSYYDYFQPEAYVPRTDTYIEKESTFNEQIDLLRHSATRSLIERDDVIVVSSVSCIYGIGSKDFYVEMTETLKLGQVIEIQQLIKRLVILQYTRGDLDFDRGNFRVRGDIVDIYPSHLSDLAWRVSFFGNEIDAITEFDPLTGHKKSDLKKISIYANSHYVAPKDTIIRAVEEIKIDLKKRLEELHLQNKIVEAHRLDQRTSYDIEMLVESGSCKGIENYSRYLSGRNPGEPPPTLFEYLPKDSLLFVDESHVTVSQINGMYNGDRARKNVLVEHGFRLPSALDNRPLKFIEWDKMRPPTIYVSATPGKYELELSNNNVTEQIIRPTGLIDPLYEVRPATHQVDDLVSEIKECTKRGFRTLVTTLTKKMSEDLTAYLKDLNIRVEYLHSEILTIDRINLINDLRKGKFDCIVGINLLREGLDIPECGLVAILDADKEGFLRSETSLIQTIGRAARNSESKVILYADKVTGSMDRALKETDRRREIQLKHNKTNNITPKTVIKSIKDDFYMLDDNITSEAKVKSPNDLRKEIEFIRKEMFQAASDLNFEKAADLRDKIKSLEKIISKI